MPPPPTHACPCTRAQVSWRGVTHPSYADWVGLLVPAGADPSRTAPAKYALAATDVDKTHLSRGEGRLRCVRVFQREAGSSGARASARCACLSSCSQPRWQHCRTRALHNHTLTAGRASHAPPHTRTSTRTQVPAHQLPRARAVCLLPGRLCAATTCRAQRAHQPRAAQRAAAAAAGADARQHVRAWRVGVVWPRQCDATG
jgi:hypothetical protein